MINSHVFLSVKTKILLKLKPANMVISTALKSSGTITYVFGPLPSTKRFRVHLWSEEMED